MATILSQFPIRALVVLRPAFRRLQQKNLPVEDFVNGCVDIVHNQIRFCRHIALLDVSLLLDTDEDRILGRVASIIKGSGIPTEQAIKNGSLKAGLKEYMTERVTENLTTEPQLPYPVEELANLDALHIGRDPDFEMTDDNIDMSAEYTSLHGPEIPFEQSEASPRDHREGTSLEADEDGSDSGENIRDSSSTSSESVPLGLSLQDKDNDYRSELLQETLEQDVNSRMKEFIRVVARELQKLRDVDDLTEGISASFDPSSAPVEKHVALEGNVGRELSQRDRLVTSEDNTDADSPQPEEAVTPERIFGAESSMPEEQVKSGDNVGIQSPKDVITQFTPNIIVKVPSSGSYVTLRHEDLKKLEGGDSPESKYLNDNLLMAGIWLWYDRLAKTRPGLSEDVVILDSTLSSAIQGEGSGNHKEAFHRAVKNKAIFGAQYLIVPMHASQMEHWYIIVVFFPGKFISSMEEEDSGYFVVLDSMLNLRRHSNAAAMLRETLKQEAEMQGIKWKSNPMMLSATVPAQRNSYDCGIYALHYLEKLMEAPIEKMNFILLEHNHTAIGNYSTLEKQWGIRAHEDLRPEFISKLLELASYA